jgi:ribonuclease HI
VNELMLLTDGSVNTQSNIGYGAYLAVSEFGLSLDSLRGGVKVRRFEHTSSTKLEVQTLLWALRDIQALGGKVIVYTDSQNIMGLPGRRERFEQNNYRSKKNRCLNNYELYQEFFRMTDQLNCKFVKVRGHQVSNQKDEIDRLFTLVDRAARNALRGDNSVSCRFQQTDGLRMNMQLIVALCYNLIYSVSMLQ